MESPEEPPSSLPFGKLLRRLRISAGLSQEALAERARMSTNGVAVLERGVRRTPQRETLALLAEALALDREQRQMFEAAARRRNPRLPGAPSPNEHNVSLEFQKRARFTSAVAGPGMSRTPAIARDENGAAADRPRHNLPLSRNSFHGRERALTDLGQLLANHRMVTLIGAGGIGKTRLALEVALGLVPCFTDGVWFIELAPLGAETFVASAISQVLGVHEIPNQPLLETVVAYLKQKAVLLILDNCEHVIATAAQIADAFLSRCPNVWIVATSREPLRIAGERCYRLPSLGFPTATATQVLRPDDADSYSAIALFVKRARAADHRFALTDAYAPIVAEICRRLDGIPLAIELAAARVSILSPQELCEQLNERFRVLTGGSRGLLPRHQTLHALIEWSHDLLDDRERALFRRLGVFVAGFTLEGAISVGTGEDLPELDVFDVLASLVDKSLILAEPSGKALRYRMLESTRAYARGKLNARDEGSASTKRHLRYLRDLFAAAKTRTDCTGCLTELDILLLVELEDVRAALNEVNSSADAGVGAELLAAIDDRWTSISLASEGYAHLERFVSLLQSEEKRHSSNLWTSIARILRRTDGLRGLQAATIAVALARDSDDAQALARALDAYAFQFTLARSFEKAASALAEAEASAPVGNASLSLRIANTRVHLSYLLGDFESAARAWDQLRKTHLLLGNLSAATSAAISLAEAEHQRGETERAAIIAQKLLPGIRDGRDCATLVHVLANLCGYLVRLDRLPEASSTALEAIAATVESDHRNNTSVTYVIEHASLTVALNGNVRLAAQLAGYTEFALTNTGVRREYTEQKTRARLEAILRDRLERTECNALLINGTEFSPQDAMTLVRAGLEGQKTGSSSIR